MKRFIAFLVLLVSIFSMSSCSTVSVNGGQEAVLIMKPWFFGHGGVHKTSVASGREWVAWSTDSRFFIITPTTYTENFDDMMTDDNTPVDFAAYLKLQIRKGETPVLLEKFGEKWYENSVAPTFRTMVRDKASMYKMFSLTSDREVLTGIQQEVKTKITEYCKSIGLPVEVMEVTIGKVTPPEEVLEETRRTAAQNQSKLTQDARASAELSRKQAEINKAIADKAYQTQMNMTTFEYLELRRLEIQKEQVELVRDKQNVTIVMGQGLQPTVPIK
jgi:regulator of protease activity HflC (stomatin/prohibitin superfamily)